ncbi:N-terminal phage integrase SAM-like domain-containing protein [Bacillus sp. Marseille-Q3570]|uniref:N-terminal phage integrase SAM-like domain-containing protein n=1 Tax=Bacillus sp. Marseille-Q3570 TaxID=2963522 RepID=UPI0021B71AE3|nr:N-terminal phage integrase SAM-like domain-containing protein [Bacillus sp. Marseille-Q3570]
MAGSIEKRGKNSWRLVVSNGLDHSGKRIKKTKTVKGKTKREAEKELAKFIAEIESGHYLDPSKLTFSLYAERWMRDYGEKELSPTTLKRYRDFLETRIIPAMGHLKLENIKPLHLLEFYKSLGENGVRADGKPGGLSTQTITHHHRLISAMLQDAVEWQLITLNPTSRVKPQKSEEAKWNTMMKLRLLNFSK